MGKTEMEIRIGLLENLLKGIERRQDRQVEVIRNMAQELNLDIEDLLYSNGLLGKKYQRDPIKKDKKGKDLPHTILGLIMDENPDGVSVEEIRCILKEVQQIAENIQMVLDPD
ncbi:MAG: hypothetical protein HFI11_07935 [Lachnospiraceae bacterium]|nr:hypothetical protein [Lachnospiraceae bacterium]